MKNNNEEKILKYLSGIITQKDSRAFEKELSESAELKNKIDEINNKLADLKINDNVIVNETYFANLLAKVYDRLEKRKKYLVRRRFYYLVPTTAALLVVLSLFMFNSKKEVELQYKDLADEVMSNFSNEEVSKEYLTGLGSEPSDIILAANNDELTFQIPSDLDPGSASFTKLFDNPVADEYSTLLNLSDQELEAIYKKLNLIILQ